MREDREKDETERQIKKEKERAMRTEREKVRKRVHHTPQFRTGQKSSGVSYSAPVFSFCPLRKLAAK